MLNPIHLQTLGVVGETGSFASAARQLGYTASAVSQQMDALERATGLVLFERGARGVQVTAAARLLADRARAVLTGLAELDADVLSIGAGRAGRVKIGCFPTAGARILPAALARLRAEHPAIDITLRIAEPAETTAMVASGELDVALVYEYAALARSMPAQLGGHDLITEELVLLSPPDLVVPDTASIGPMAGAADWISSGSGTGGEATTYRICADLGFVPNITLRTEYYDLVTEFVAAGLGVALVPALGIVSRHRVNILPVQSKWSNRTVGVRFRAGASNPAVSSVVESFARTVRGIDWGPHLSLPDSVLSAKPAEHPDS